MGRLDTLTKEYMKQPSIFADVFNQFLYHGRQVIVPDRLVELDTTEIAVPYGADQASVPEQRYRDVLKMLLTMTDGLVAYCLLAVENEGKINYAMPVKDGLYDFLQLAHQVTKASISHKDTKSKDNRPSGDEFLSGFWKSDKLLPVMTIVIYFGAEEWDGPLSLREMYTDCGEEVLKYVADYRVNLIAPRGLSDDEIDEFQTNMREIMKYIKYSNDKKRLDEIIGTEQRFKNVERSAVEIINAATNSNMKIDEGKETIDMCLAIQEMREESRLEGRKEGRNEGRNEGEIIGAITFAKELGVSREDVKKSFMVKYQKNEEETEELMGLYWK
ncbi:MAG: Rpn family recombination-promoting nuclease/putative transposase [Lachnospiraceae bacterium]|nr:Rpn family recombination-promoting nuclease/putative transposase [Lachnospiraceae bacterium]MDE7272535.1 Rpn family recombination-promoting nuclease/putative transposase [Lachnospiraceae bacterium]